MQIPASPLSTQCCFILFSMWFASGKDGIGSDTHGERRTVEQEGSLPFSQAVLCVAAVPECLARWALPRGWVAQAGVELTGLILCESQGGSSMAVAMGHLRELPLG